MLLLKWYLGGTGAFQKLTKHFIDCEPDTGSAAENKNGLIPFEKIFQRKLKDYDNCHNSLDYNSGIERLRNGFVKHKVQICTHWRLLSLLLHCEIETRLPKQLSE